MKAAPKATILLIECSPRGAASCSRLVAQDLLARLQAVDRPARVVRRDLAADPPPFVDAAFAASLSLRRGESPAREAPALACSEALIAELEAADILILSTPMHNFTVPAVLKAWIDQVVRIQRSFRSTPEGKVGLLRDRPTFVISASGGLIAGPAARQPDFLTPYLRTILATIGLRDVSFLHLTISSREPQAFECERQRARAWFDERLISDRAMSTDTRPSY